MVRHRHRDEDVAPNGSISLVADRPADETLPARPREGIAPRCADRASTARRHSPLAAGKRSRRCRWCPMDPDPSATRVSEAASIRRIFAAVLGARRECLRDIVGQKDHGAAGTAMHRRRFDRCPQISERRHVTHRIVDEHVIELAIQSQRAHVAGDVFRLRIDRAALRQHAFGEIRQRHRELHACRCDAKLPPPQPSSSSVAVARRRQRREAPQRSSTLRRSAAGRSRTAATSSRDPHRNCHASSDASRSASRASVRRCPSAARRNTLPRARANCLRSCAVPTVVDRRLRQQLVKKLVNCDPADSAADRRRSLPRGSP